MAAEDEVPPWVTFILGQVQNQFADMKRELATLVTRDSFAQEQSRVNERFAAQGREISEVKRENETLKVNLQAEASARVTSEAALAKERRQEQKDREKEQGNRRWMVFAMIATPFASAAVLWVLNGGLQTTGV